MQLHCLTCRIAAVVTVLIFLPALLFYGTMQPEPDGNPDLFAVSRQVEGAQQFCDSLPASPGEFLPLKVTHLSRPHAQGRNGHFRTFYAGTGRQAKTGCPVRWRQVTYALRQFRTPGTHLRIIAYLHDKDGRKGRDFVLLTVHKNG